MKLLPLAKSGALEFETASSSAWQQGSSKPELQELAPKILEALTWAQRGRATLV